MSDGIQVIRERSKGNKGIAAAAKNRRREEAQARQAAYDKLSLDDKIKSCHPGSRQHKKLVSLKDSIGG